MSATSRDNAVTILTSGCHFNGKLYCRGSSRIGGKIEGQVISEGLLIIEEDAIITADIKAEEAVIQGRVTGRLEAAGRVELCASSRFDGDISSPVLVVNEGAQFNGHSSMPGSATGDEKEKLADLNASLKAQKNQKKDKIPNIVPQNDGKLPKAPEINMPN